jgi:hypothetical protein
MKNWKSLLKADPTEWLLEDNNPSVKYFSLRWLIGKPENDVEVVSASQAIAQSEPVKVLLRRQRPEGYWGTDTRPHHGTRRNLLLLKWLGYQGDEGVKKAMDYRINGCLKEDGTYGIDLKGRTVELPCHGADLLGQMLWFGYKGDQRALKLLGWLVQIQGEDGVWPCVSKLRPFSCLWATADVLRVYRDLPVEWLTPQIVESQRLSIEQFLNSKLYQYGKAKPSPRWFEFGFPLQWDSDILEVLGLLAPYISPDEERIQAGLRFVLEKQDGAGRWPCEKHPKGGGWMKKFIDFDEIGQPSKWVTLHAMKMLKALYEEKAD